MLKILQARLQQYMNCELSDVQTGFRKCRDQIANMCWIIEKARELEKNIYLCFIDYTTGFDCVDHNELWKILKEKGIPEHLTCFLRNDEDKKPISGHRAAKSEGSNETELVLTDNLKLPGTL